jgi:hypothetical protein
MIRNLTFLLLTISVTSCLKKEIPIERHDPGETISNQIDLGSDYRYFAFYDFESNSYSNQNLKSAWDLGFETESSGFRIIINGAKSMAVGIPSGTTFTQVVDTNGVTWRYDASSGNLDSTAMIHWQTIGKPYILDLGYDHSGNHQGYKKMEILHVDANQYTIHYADLNGANDQNKTITKNAAYNFTFFSFLTNSEVTIEPKKETWDIYFGQFTHMFEPDFPYLVTGALTNRNGVEVAQVFDIPFESITFSHIGNYTFSKHINRIGYEWKYFDGSSYSTDPTKNFIVKTVEGNYYKIHFIDFYNSNGIKGTPTFEVQAL